MGPEVVNKNKNCVFNDPYAGRDLYITMLEDKEREFVVTHNANIKPVAYFTGRETELQDLRQRIEEGRKSVLVSGMGGIGKTHICRKLFEEYLKMHADNKYVPFKHIGYVEYNGDMGLSLQKCLKFKEQEDPKQNQEAAWRELEYLASDGKLLLFIDNVDKIIGADPGLQRLRSIPGAVVLTSRKASFSDEFEPYQIGFLNMEQCMEIFGRIRFGVSGKKISMEEIPDLEYIIETLAGKHTITIEFLAHLARTKLWTVKRLREELEEKGFRLEFRKNGESINIQKSYEALYDLSKLTDAEQNILEAFSVFPYIPLAAETCNEWLLADACVSVDADILMELYHKGWLQFDEKQETYALHPVFAQFVYGKCKLKARKHYGLIEACQRSLTIPKSGSALECQQYIPFAENILEKVSMRNGAKQAEFIEVLAYLLQYIAEYKKAQELFKKSLKMNKKRLRKKYSDIATGYNYLANTYIDQGEYQKAEKLYEKALRIYIRVYGKEHQDTSTIYSNLASVYKYRGEYPKAEELYERSLCIRKKVYGEEHLNTAQIYNNLANLYECRGEYPKAEKLYEKVLYIFIKVYGEEHSDTAMIYNNLACVYARGGECKKAEELYEKALSIFKRAYGEEHPNTAKSYNNLAFVYGHQGEYQKAEELYERSLCIRKRVLGEGHLDTAESYNNLACIYEKRGEYKIALVNCFKAYKIFLQTLHKDHPNTYIIYENMKFAYSKWNSEDNFEQWLEEQMKK